MSDRQPNLPPKLLCLAPNGCRLKADCWRFLARGHMNYMHAPRLSRDGKSCEDFWKATYSDKKSVGKE